MAAECNHAAAARHSTCSRCMANKQMWHKSMQHGKHCTVHAATQGSSKQHCMAAECNHAAAARHSTCSRCIAKASTSRCCVRACSRYKHCTIYAAVVRPQLQRSSSSGRRPQLQRSSSRGRRPQLQLSNSCSRIYNCSFSTRSRTSNCSVPAITAQH